MVGINNRDLDTFHVTLETTETLRPLIPAGIAVVAESGIFHLEDVERLERCGIDAVLVGEALVTAPDIAGRVRELSGYKREGVSL
jgi:indole-3-glycerol phosphate synthase